MKSKYTLKLDLPSPESLADNNAFSAISVTRSAFDQLRRAFLPVITTSILGFRLQWLSIIPPMK